MARSLRNVSYTHLTAIGRVCRHSPHEDKHGVWMVTFLGITPGPGNIVPQASRHSAARSWTKDLRFLAFLWHNISLERRLSDNGYSSSAQPQGRLVKSVSVPASDALMNSSNGSERDCILCFCTAALSFHLAKSTFARLVSFQSWFALRTNRHQCSFLSKSKGHGFSTFSFVIRHLRYSV